MKLKHTKIQEFNLTDFQIELLKKVKSEDSFLEYNNPQFKNLSDYFSKRDVKVDVNVTEFLRRNENGTYGTAITLYLLHLLRPVTQLSPFKFVLSDLGRELLEQNNL